MVPGKRFFPLVAHPLCDKDSQEEYPTAFIFIMMKLVEMIFLKISISIFTFLERDPNRPPPPKTSGKLEFEYFGDRV